MKFLFNCYNHSDIGKRSLEDIIKIVGHQLSALGHEFARSDGINGFIRPEEGLTIVVEGFDEDSVQILERAKNHGARIAILATEEPTNLGFNHGVAKEMVDRQRVFPVAAKCAEIILSLVPGAEKWFSQFAPSAHVELGYAPSLCQSKSDFVDHDFGFYGTMTKRRLNILNRIVRKGGTVRAISTMPEAAYRDKEMRRARVLLQLRINEKMGLVSSCRCATALHLGRPVVAEPHALAEYWKDVIHFSKSESALLDDAFMVKSLWKSYYAKQMAKFKELLSPERCIGEPLERLGIVRKP